MRVIEGPAQRRIEFRKVVELELADDVAREFARHHELHLAGHRLLVDGGVAFGRPLRLRTQEDVFAGLDQDPRLGLVARRDHVDGKEGEPRRSQRQKEDAAFAAPERPPERTQIKLVDGLRHASSRRLTRLHEPTSLTRQPRDSPIPDHKPLRLMAR